MPIALTTLLHHLSSLPNQACSRRTALGLLGAAGLLPFLPACSSQPLRIAAHPWPGYELLFLAQRDGWLSPEQVRLLATTSATDSLQAVTDGAADAAALTLDEVLRARSNGIPLTVALVFDLSAGADVVMAHPGISSIQQLAGKRVGVEQSALGALVLQLTLQAAGLTEQQVTVVPVTPDKHLEAWQADRLDAVITYEPTASQLVVQGARIIYDSRSMPGMIFDVLAVKSSLLHKQAHGIRTAIQGHLRALDQLRHNPQDAAFRMAGRLNMSPLQLLQAFKGLELPSLQENRRYLGGAAPAISAAARTVHDLMLAKGLLKHPDQMADLVSSVCLPVEG